MCQQQQKVFLLCFSYNFFLIVKYRRGHRTNWYQIFLPMKKPVTLSLSSVWWLTLWGFNSHSQDWNQSNWGRNGRLLTYFKLDTHSQQCCRRAHSLMTVLTFGLFASSAITWRKLFSYFQPLAHAWSYWKGRSRRAAVAAESGRRGAIGKTVRGSAQRWVAITIFHPEWKWL